MRRTLPLLTLWVACSSAGPTITDPVRDVAAVIPDDGNDAPVLYKVGERIVEVGRPLEITLRAEDADGDVLVYSAHSLPKGASFEKSPPVFRWTPAIVGEVGSPTFLVSDGTDSDRETVRIQVVSETQNHAPRFQIVGDQAVEIGGTLSLLLQAVDPDGDSLTFAIDGTPPAGATIAAGTGVFNWKPADAEQGTVPKVTFTVSDGTAEDRLDVQIYVLAPGQNRPPSFNSVPPQSVQAGVLYTLSLTASDPEGDPLTFGFEGTLPAGGTFDPALAKFTWTPPLEAAGSTVTFLFSLTDGQYEILGELDVDVLDPNVVAGQCKSDVNEPNDTSATASALTVGTYEKLSLCDNQTTPIDVDWYTIALTPGQTLSLTVTFEHDDGDLDVALYRAGQLTAAIALADGAGDSELISWTATQAETVLVKVFGSGQAVFQSPYTMIVSTSGLDCDDDSFEPNDTKLQPTSIPQNGVQSGLAFCPGDFDYFAVPLYCGETLTAELNYTPTKGPLDIYVYRSATATAPAAVSKQVGSTEAVFYEAQRDEEVLLLVRGDPPESTLNQYTLVTDVSGGTGCSDDLQEPNNSKAKAIPMETPDDLIKGLVLCCNEDWFFLPLTVGDSALVSITFEVASPVQAELYISNDPEPIAVAEADSDGLTLTLESAPFSGNFYVRVEGSAGTPYSIETLAFGGDGCLTSKGCDDNKVCWKSTGACVSAYCLDEEDCPTGQEMPCVANSCLEGCTYDADCKFGYGCKGFDVGNYCGPKGSGATGSACATYADCNGASSCTFADKGGYCSKVGCQANSECGTDGNCVMLSTGTTLCAKPCKSNSDCRGSEGYTCQPKTLPNGIPVNVCLPNS